MPNFIVTPQDQVAISLVLEALDDLGSGRLPSPSAMNALREHAITTSVFMSTFADKILRDDNLKSNSRMRRAVFVSRAIQLRTIGVNCEGNA